MFALTEFLNIKTKQLTHYIHGYWNQQIPYSELQLFFWDTMEEWSLVNCKSNLPCGDKERVFWHLLHQIHYWPNHVLLDDEFIRTELINCISFLQGEAVVPVDCVGIRP